MQPHNSQPVFESAYASSAALVVSDANIRARAYMRVTVENGLPVFRCDRCGAETIGPEASRDVAAHVGACARRAA